MITAVATVLTRLTVGVTDRATTRQVSAWESESAARINGSILAARANLRNAESWLNRQAPQQSQLWQSRLRDSLRQIEEFGDQRFAPPGHTLPQSRGPGLSAILHKQAGPEQPDNWPNWVYRLQEDTYQ